jgi:hypothetical protein
MRQLSDKNVAHLSSSWKDDESLCIFRIHAELEVALACAESADVDRLNRIEDVAAIRGQGPIAPS